MTNKELIAALEAELIEQAKANGKGSEREAALATENAALREKLAVAREALKPLANVDLWIGEDQVTGDEIAVISVSQIIKARQALKELDNA